MGLHQCTATQPYVLQLCSPRLPLRQCTVVHVRPRTTRSATMIGIAPATLANPKSDTALGGAPGSKKLPAQIKTNNQHTQLDKAMPVRGTP